MDTTATSPTTSPDAANSPGAANGPDTANLLFIPTSGIALQTASPPALSPNREDSTDHLITENDSGSTLEILPPLQTPPSLHDDPINDPAPTLPLPPIDDPAPTLPPLPVRSPAKSPIPSPSGTPTPRTPPLLACAGSGSFDPVNVHGDFISKDTCVYWESVPGGEKWFSLVKSYLELEALPPIKGVSPKSIQGLLRSRLN